MKNKKQKTKNRLILVILIFFGILVFDIITYINGLDGFFTPVYARICDSDSDCDSGCCCYSDGFCGCSPSVCGGTETTTETTTDPNACSGSCRIGACTGTEQPGDGTCSGSRICCVSRSSKSTTTTGSGQTTTISSGQTTTISSGQTTTVSGSQTTTTIGCTQGSCSYGQCECPGRWMCTAGYCNQGGSYCANTCSSDQCSGNCDCGTAHCQSTTTTMQATTTISSGQTTTTLGQGSCSSGKVECPAIARCEVVSSPQYGYICAPTESYCATSCLSSECSNNCDCGTTYCQSCIAAGSVGCGVGTPCCSGSCIGGSCASCTDDGTCITLASGNTYCDTCGDPSVPLSQQRDYTCGASGAVSEGSCSPGTGACVDYGGYVTVNGVTMCNEGCTSTYELKECYCNGNDVRQVISTCSYGCSSGGCNSPPSQTTTTTGVTTTITDQCGGTCGTMFCCSGYRRCNGAGQSATCYDDIGYNCANRCLTDQCFSDTECQTGATTYQSTTTVIGGLTTTYRSTTTVIGGLTTTYRSTTTVPAGSCTYSNINYQHTINNGYAASFSIADNGDGRLRFNLGYQGACTVYKSNIIRPQQKTITIGDPGDNCYPNMGVCDSSGCTWYFPDSYGITPETGTYSGNAHWKWSKYEQKWDISFNANCGPTSVCGNGILESGEICDTARLCYYNGCQLKCDSDKTKLICNPDCQGYTDTGMCDTNCGSDAECNGKPPGDVWYGPYSNDPSNECKERANQSSCTAACSYITGYDYRNKPDATPCSNCGLCQSGVCKPRCLPGTSCVSSICTGFEAWSIASRIPLRIGQKTPIPIYVKNLGEKTDSYIISIAIDPPSHLIYLEEPTSFTLEDVSPGEVKSVNPRATMLAVMSNGYMKAAVTSKTTGDNKTLTVTLLAELPVSLPEFNVAYLMAGIIIVLLAFYGPTRI